VTTPRTAPAPVAQSAPAPAPAPVRRPGVLGPVVPTGVRPRRGVTPAPTGYRPPTPQVAPAPYRQPAPAAPAPRPLDDFDDSE